MPQEHNMDRAVLVGLNAPCLGPEETASDASLEELEALLETAGGFCTAKILQNRSAPDARTFIGQGKALEVKFMAEDTGATLAVFDNALSPGQMRVLEELLGIPVLDRSALILDIFAQRARSAEGRLQVELAQYKYLLPRLSGMGLSLSRQGGGIGTRGPGETQLETDRRHIRSRIAKLEQELQQVRQVRAVQRRQRTKNDVPVVALVGYTNAGKSTLLNRLTGAGIPANNRLFDTLDTTARLLTVSDTLEVILTDTVGFIAKLPHHLVEAFQATLEELAYASLLIHVIDASDPERQAHMAVVERLTAQLAPGTPVIRCYNKADLVSPLDIPAGKDQVAVSAAQGVGLDRLLQLVEQGLNRGKHRANFLLPYDQGRILERLHRQGQVLSVDYRPEGIAVEAVCGPVLYGQLTQYVAEA
ncbi:MAG TPA: GTPase HflX [Candidatus Faecousia faecigallinarum]|nr:GTPase HflX [Candidatus Faecousia faecigallinarum]